ncbi:hypothetical protein OYE22_25670 [Streptomyces sp. 71268]|uniref:hypothetical protein n=1 Tax=Streptomyces sp. 71268 TaxID=3002640 RepID=UPI0023F6E975|nr:hypothetical protein [Streptomyces sp. 71268]WEV28186.1 hypothetical protein OYE22_25670 [Streptomyces sp. 71268]
MEQQQATAPPSEPPGPLDPELAEAALTEHYRHLVRLGYVVLPPDLGRTRRVLTAHALAQRALPRGATDAAEPAATRSAGLPGQRGARGAADGYPPLRLRVLRAALDAARPRRRWELPPRAALPPLLPQVWGLRLAPRSDGPAALALEQTLASLSGPGRAAFALRDLDGLDGPALRRVLADAGVADAAAAVAEADGVPRADRADRPRLDSPEFDPCALRARPTDLARRRQHGRAALAAAAALAVCAVLLGLPGDGWGPDGAAAPTYARNPAADAALDPNRLTRAEPDAWRTASRRDFATWPARGDRLGDRELLRRALAVWARPGGSVRVAATPGTLPGPPAGPPQLLFAGTVDQAAVVLFHDGLRVVRYAEARSGDGGGALLDLGRADAADQASATALVLGRVGGTVRYLTAPWVRSVAVRDLLAPQEAARPVTRGADGVTAPVRSPVQARECTSWPALQLGPHLATDLGELVPARLTYGPPGAGTDATGAQALRDLARTACHLPELRGAGVRDVNAWQFASQVLPEAAGSAAWVCTRAETWRGTGARTLAQLQLPARRPDAPGTVAARSKDSAACGPRAPHVLSGVLWKSPAGQWYVLAAGDSEVTSITLSGGMTGSAPGNLLALPTKPGTRPDLSATLASGERLTALR